MSINYEDFWVQRRSLEEIETIASRARRKLGCDDHSPVPQAAHAIGMLGFEIRIGSSEGMGKAKAFARAEKRELYFRPDIVVAIQNDEISARAIALHEVGHVVLEHVTQTQAFLLDDGNESPSFLGEENSAEWQAHSFSDAIMMPAAMVTSCADARQLATRARAPLERAFIRFNLVQMRRPRSTPESVKKAIEKMRISASAKTRSQSTSTLPDATRKKLLWSCLPEVPGESTDLVRAVDGRWYIRWDLHEHSCLGGWRILGDEIIAWEDERSR
jgi:Zn-dependent peptidase ImmA (M78 family)